MRAAASSPCARTSRRHLRGDRWHAAPAAHTATPQHDWPIGIRARTAARSSVARGGTSITRVGVTFLVTNAPRVTTSAPARDVRDPARRATLPIAVLRLAALEAQAGGLAVGAGARPANGRGSRGHATARSLAGARGPASADGQRATPGLPLQTLQLGVQSLDLRARLGAHLCELALHLREIALGPDQLGVVGLGDLLRLLDERDVLAHGQHGSTASNSAWTTSPTASAIA